MVALVLWCGLAAPCETHDKWGEGGSLKWEKHGVEGIKVQNGEHKRDGKY